MYKTENRFAKVGERVLTTQGFEGEFNAGEVYTVATAYKEDHKLSPAGSVFVEEMDWLLTPDEYVVIIGKETEQ